MYRPLDQPNAGAAWPKSTKYKMAIDISKLEESPHLIDLLIQMEDTLDSLDTYVFPEWFKGRVVSGPIVKRYWLSMTLEYDNKPDEKGALRLIKHGLKVKMSKSHRGERTVAAKGKKEHQHSEGIWLVDVSIPRRLITVLNAGQLDFYDEEVDVEDVMDASDAGMNDETGYVDDQDNADMSNGNSADPAAGGDPLGAPEGEDEPKQ